jgi:hypothetical protein
MLVDFRKQQREHWRLKKFGLAPKTLTNLYRCIIESLSGSLDASQGANYQPYRTPTASDVTGRPKIFSKSSTTRATACSPRLSSRWRGQYRCIKAGAGPKD